MIFFNKKADNQQFKFGLGGIDSYKFELKKAYQLALSAGLSGDTNWENLMLHYKLKPLSLEEKVKIVSITFPLKKGALPLELRKVLEAINDNYQKNFQDLEREIAKQDLDNLSAEDKQLFISIKQFLAVKWPNLIDKLVNKYLKEVKKSLDLGSIFKNASKSTDKYISQAVDTRSNIYLCKSCGAPRINPEEYNHCAYCGSLIFQKSAC